MTRVHRLDDLLRSNRMRHQRGSHPRPDLTGREGVALRARREARPRDNFALRCARLAVVLALGLLAFGLWQQRVDRIVIEGLVLGPMDRVHEACAPLLGMRWMTFDAAVASVRLRTEPWFEHVAFERRAPSTVVIRLTEAEPIFCLAVGDEVMAVDGHGCLLPASASLTLDALPRLRGLRPEHGALRPEDRQRVRHLRASLARGPWPWDGGLAAVDLREAGAVELVTGDGVILRLGERDLVEQLRAADAAWGRLALAPGDRLDLRFRRQVVLARAASSTQGG